MGTVPLQFPVTIPPNERAIIVLNNQIAGSIELQTSEGNMLLKVGDGWAKPFQFLTSGRILTGNVFIPRGVYTFVADLENATDASELAMQIDDKNLTLSKPVEGETSYYRLLSPIFLECEVHNITFPCGLSKLFFFSALSSASETDFENLFHSYINITTEFSIEKTNPTMYRLHLSSSKPSFLVLSESYHSDWRIYFGQQTWLSTLGTQPVPEDQHLVANGYANAWYVPNGESTITIYFQAQNLSYFGIMISSITLVATAGYLSYDRTRKKRPKSSPSKPPVRNNVDLPCPQKLG
jgi:hypothetical protein